MTLSPEARAELFQKLEGTMKGRMERIFEQAMLGEVEWDRDIWSGILDWISGPLRMSMMYGPDIPADQRGEKSPAYKAFETFDRARMQGVLDEGPVVHVVFAAIKELQHFEADALSFLKVKFKEANAVQES